jgi:hypothetical protein
MFFGVFICGSREPINLLPLAESERRGGTAPAWDIQSVSEKVSSKGLWTWSNVMSHLQRITFAFFSAFLVEEWSGGPITKRFCEGAFNAGCR